MEEGEKRYRPIDDRSMRSLLLIRVLSLVFCMTICGFHVSLVGALAPSNAISYMSYHVPDTAIFLELSTTARAHALNPEIFADFVTRSRQRLRAEATHHGGFGRPLVESGFKFVYRRIIVVVKGLGEAREHWPRFQDADTTILGLSEAFSHLSYRECLFNVYKWDPVFGRGARFGSGWLLRSRYEGSNRTEPKNREEIEALAARIV